LHAAVTGNLAAKEERWDNVPDQTAELLNLSILTHDGGAEGESGHAWEEQGQKQIQGFGFHNNIDMTRRGAGLIDGFSTQILSDFVLIDLLTSAG